MPAALLSPALTARGPMPVAAWVLLLTAAALHAGWNLVIKRAENRFILIWWAMIASGFAALPLLALGPPLPGRALLYALASSIVEAGYFVTLGIAYGKGDFSLIYPVARGAAPALLAFWSVLFLGERLRPLGIAGLALIVAGVAVVGAARRLAEVPRIPQVPEIPEVVPTGDAAPGMAKTGSSLVGVGLALLVALFISLYSTIDGAAVRFASPAPYTAAVFALSALLLTPAMLHRYGWATLEAAGRRDWRAILGVGAASLLGYSLVLAAFAISPIAYAGAVREVSVVFGALAGWLFLGERFGPRRTAGAVLVFGGILLIAFAGR